MRTCFGRVSDAVVEFPGLYSSCFYPILFTYFSLFNTDVTSPSFLCLYDLSICPLLPTNLYSLLSLPNLSFTIYSSLSLFFFPTTFSVLYTLHSIFHSRTLTLSSTLPLLRLFSPLLTPLACRTSCS